jgi:hypothetical protein
MTNAAIDLTYAPRLYLNFDKVSPQELQSEDIPARQGPRKPKTPDGMSRIARDFSNWPRLKASQTQFIDLDMTLSFRRKLSVW